MRRATLSDLVNGHAALSPEMALRLQKAFAVNMDMLLRMQVWHDAVTMRRHAADIDVKQVAAVAMTKRMARSPRMARVAVARRAVAISLGIGLGSSAPQKEARPSQQKANLAKAWYFALLHTRSSAP